MQGRHFLHIPGPSPIPDRILRAIAMPIITRYMVDAACAIIVPSISVVHSVAAILLSGGISTAGK